MAMKMRVLYFSSKGKMAAYADAICAKLDCKADVIPPAYSCENERLVIIGVSAKKEIPNQLRLFCAGLKKGQAHNVAFFFDGPKETATDLLNIVRQAGANVFDDVFYCDGGLPFKFLKTIKDDERDAINTWAKKIFDQVSQA